LRRLLLAAWILIPCAVFASPTELIPILETLVNLSTREARSPEATPTNIPPGLTLRLGSKGKRVTQLNNRLAELGFKASGEHFDALTDAAVRSYQQSVGITVDGRVDEQTRFNLNLSNRDKIALLRAQFDEMEGLLAANADGRFVVVNLPVFSLQAFDKGKRVLESRVVIGSPARPTPLMKTSLTGIVLNPPWAPPPTILAKDIFRGGEINPRAVSRLGLKLIDANGKPVPLDAISTQSDLDANDYRLMQAPGDKNALGRLKFDLDNPFGVYLHDTNHRDLFQKDFRALSSGCVRVDRFRELAAWMLGNTPGEVDQALLNHRTRRLNVEKIPVFTVYWPAESVGGLVVFHRDIYDRLRNPH